MPSICLHEFEVKGILDGSVTELWRPCKIQPPGEGYQLSRLMDSTAKEDKCNIDKLHWIKLDTDGITVIDSDGKYFESPFGSVGTRITGKETWIEVTDKYNRNGFIYKSDGWHTFDDSWKSPIAMPPKASRITLINTGVECKLMREITEDEARAAGSQTPYPSCRAAWTERQAWKNIWYSLCAKKGYPFESAYAWKLKFESEVKR
jgi:hypothetical protein